MRGFMRRNVVLAGTLTSLALALGTVGPPGAGAMTNDRGTGLHERYGGLASHSGRRAPPTAAMPGSWVALRAQAPTSGTSMRGKRLRATSAFRRSASVATFTTS